MKLAIIGRMGEVDIQGAFRREYGTEPSGVVRAPGRVNLIGEHTDYNQGFVLPMAIDLEIHIAFRRRSDAVVRVKSLDLGAQSDLDLTHLEAARSGWPIYLSGVAWALQAEGWPVHGWEGVISSAIPIGSGLSSSAALGLAVARAFCAVGGWKWDPVSMAKLVQHAENAWVGVRCGIMDQMASACGKRGHALLIDCRDLAIEAVPLPAQAAVVVLDTGTRHDLSLSSYNDRRAECEAAAGNLGVTSLRQCTPADLTAQAARLDPVLLRRARHVITENERTLAGAEALRKGDCVGFGDLMNASHRSLEQDFEVSTPELDRMASLARASDGCFGARMMGGGFGGSVVCLARRQAAADLARAVAAAYSQEMRLGATGLVCQAAEGASLLS